MPLAVEQFDLSAYDLVLSSSYSVAKGVLTGADQVHICYCHSPMRYAWDLQHQYLRETGLTRGLRSWVARYFLHRIRQWDFRSASGVDDFLANSQFVARRIAKFYRREASVIYPPVDVDQFTPAGTKEDFYVTASRMVPYKRIDLIVEAFAGMPSRRLLVIGDGPQSARIAAKSSPNIRLIGQQPTAALREHLQRARAFVFAAEEDFGIAPVEALACGTPVIAYGRGGVLETVHGPESATPCGLFFYEQTVPAIQDAIMRFEQLEQRFSSQVCRERAMSFGAGVFRERFKQHVNQVVQSRASRPRTDGLMGPSHQNDRGNGSQENP
jgi:glycosyltransferase involved in cell wall biosynthesis